MIPKDIPLCVPAHVRACAQLYAGGFLQIKGPVFGAEAIIKLLLCSPTLSPPPLL